MTVTRSRPSTTHQKYLKADIVAGLKDAVAAVERAYKTYEEQVAEWRKIAVANFSHMVETWEPGNYFNWDAQHPPKRSRLCEDWRIQSITQTLVRIEAMTPEDDGSIRLRADDKVFEQIAIAACE